MKTKIKLFLNIIVLYLPMFYAWKYNAIFLKDINRIKINWSITILLKRHLISFNFFVRRLMLNDMLRFLLQSSKYTIEMQWKLFVKWNQLSLEFQSSHSIQKSIVLEPRDEAWIVLLGALKVKWIKTCKSVWAEL